MHRDIARVSADGSKSGFNRILSMLAAGDDLFHLIVSSQQSLQFMQTVGPRNDYNFGYGRSALEGGHRVDDDRLTRNLRDDFIESGAATATRRDDHCGQHFARLTGGQLSSHFLAKRLSIDASADLSLQSFHDRTHLRFGGGVQLHN